MTFYVFMFLHKKATLKGLKSLTFFPVPHISALLSLKCVDLFLSFFFTGVGDTIIRLNLSPVN